MYKALLALAIFLSFYLTLGWLPLFDLDEGAFSEATREMLKSGDYITTYLNGELRFDKPIFIYWWQALSVKLFGLNEFAVRLPSAIAGTLWIVATFWFTKKFSDEKRAFIATFAMVAALQITIITKAAIADALLNLFIALSMFALYLLYTTKEKRWIYLTFLFVGLGTLTKGPVAIMIPFVVSFLFFTIKGEWRFWLASVFNPLGIMIFLLVAGPWYVLEYMDQGEKFINGFFFKHNLSRFSGAMEGHYGSLFYYIPVFLVGLLPFTSLHIKSLFNFKKNIHDDLSLYLLVWFGFVFVFFSFSGTKLPHYVIYGYTPLFIMIGLFYREKSSALWLLLPSMFLYLLLLVFGIFVFMGGASMIKDAYAVEIIQGSLALFDWKYYLPLVLAVGVLAIMIAKKEHYFQLYLFTGFLFIAVINGVVLPLVAHAQQTPVKEAAMLAKEKDLDVKMWHINVPSFIFYTEKKVQRGELQEGDIILTKSNKLNSLKKYDIIYKNRGIALIKVEKR